MTKQRVINACISIFNAMQKSKWVPNPKTRGKTSTGNTAYNALRYKVEGDIFHVYIDDSISPYCYYTNEPWTAKRWKGKPNPNEDWWGRFCEEFGRRLAKRLRGNIK